jgi:hypothetical protein
MQTQTVGARLGRVVRACALAGLALSAVAGASTAEPFGPPDRFYDDVVRQDGRFVVGLSIRGGVQQLPRFNSTKSNFATLGGSLFHDGRFDPNVQFVQPGGSIGYIFRDDTWPAWLGRRVRASLYGSYVYGTWSRHVQTETPAVGGGVIAGIGGITFVSGPNGAGVPFRLDESLRIVREGFDVGLKLESEVPLAPDLSLSPGIALFGGHTFESFDFHHSYTAIGVTAPGSVSERLRTIHLGFSLGATLNWQVRPGFAFYAVGHAGPIWQRSRLTGEDCLNNGNFPIGSLCSAANLPFQSSSVSDTRSAVGFRGGATLGVAMDFRYAIVNVGSFMRYDSHIPGVRNPQLTSQTFVGVNVVGGNEPARVTFRGGFAYGGFAVIRVPIH